MKLLTKSLLAAVAVTLISSGAAMADHTVRRIEHPNGLPTFAHAPHDRGTPTIGVFAGERSFGRREVEVRSERGMTDPAGRTLVPMHQGRGQVIYVPVGR